MQIDAGFKKQQSMRRRCPSYTRVYSKASKCNLVIPIDPAAGRDLPLPPRLIHRQPDSTNLGDKILFAPLQTNTLRAVTGSG